MTERMRKRVRLAAPNGDSAPEVDNVLLYSNLTSAHSIPTHPASATPLSLAQVS